MINRGNEILPQHCHGYVGGQIEWQGAKIRLAVTNTRGCADDTRLGEAG
jgi:hypothetical protein